MNYKNCNTTKQNENNDNYFLSITNNNTGVVEEMYLSNLEFKILNTAVQHNRGMINLLSNVETIYGLFRKGLVTITKDNLAVPCVSDVITYLLNPETTEDFSENPFKEENKPTGFFKIFKNLSICFCCL